MVYVGFFSLGAQDALLKNHSNPAAFVGDEGQAPPATSLFAIEIEDDDNRDLKGAL